VFRWLFVCGRSGALRPWAAVWFALSRKARRAWWLLLWRSGWRALSLRERAQIRRRFSRWAGSRPVAAVLALLAVWLFSLLGGRRG
jgi:hypothetical protein